MTKVKEINKKVITLCKNNIWAWEWGHPEGGVSESMKIWSHRRLRSAELKWQVRRSELERKQREELIRFRQWRDGNHCRVRSSGTAVMVAEANWRTTVGREFWRLGSMAFGKVSYMSTEVTRTGKYGVHLTRVNSLRMRRRQTMLVDGKDIAVGGCCKLAAWEAKGGCLGRRRVWGQDVGQRTPAPPPGSEDSEMT